MGTLQEQAALLEQGPGVEKRLGLSWLPGETLFSLCSRYHRLSAQHRSRHTCIALFGAPRAGIAHDFPDHIDAFVERTGGLLGDSLDVIEARTVLPFYLPFKSPPVAKDAIDALRGPGIGGLKFRLGLLTSGFRAHHPLKWCARCAEDDLGTHRVAYWHLAHQYPGVWVCQHHRFEPLVESGTKSSGTGRFDWFLPDAVATASMGTHGSRDLDNPLTAILVKFATASTALAAMPAAAFDSRRLVRCHLARMLDSGHVRPNGRLDRSAAPDLSKFLRPLAGHSELAPLAISENAAKSHLARALSASRAQMHPLRHVAFAVWLYGSWTSFVNAYEGTPEEGEPGLSIAPTQIAGGPRSDPRRSHLLDLIREQHLSVTKAAATVGVDVKTGLIWAAHAGIQAMQRPKKLHHDLRLQMIKRLKAGISKQEAASQFDVSIETVTTLLLTEVGLHESWVHVRIDRRRATERRTWLTLIKRHQVLGIRFIRSLAPSTYSWLYRNDHQWLKEQAVPRRAAAATPRVDWPARDGRLSQAVVRASIEIVDGNPRGRLTLSLLCQRVPALRPKLRNLDRLPATRAAIERALRYRPGARSDPLF